MYVYNIPNDVPPSLNKYLGNSNNFNIYRKDKKKWEDLVFYAIHESDKPEEPLEWAHVRLTYLFADKRRRDPDNYSGKFILDGLVKHGVLEDDSFKCVCLTLRAQFGCSEKGVVVIVDDVPF